MRRSDREVTELCQQLEIIQRCDSCCLAMHDAQAETPYLVELSFGMEHADGKTMLYFHSATEGKKLDLIRQDARVSFFMSCGTQINFQK